MPPRRRIGLHCVQWRSLGFQLHRQLQENLCEFGICHGELGRNGDCCSGVLGRAQHCAHHNISRSGHVVLVQTFNVQPNILTWASLVHSLMMHLHIEHFSCVRIRGRVCWQGDDFFAWLHNNLPHPPSQHKVGFHRGSVLCNPTCRASSAEFGTAVPTALVMPFCSGPRGPNFITHFEFGCCRGYERAQQRGRASPADSATAVAAALVVPFVALSTEYSARSGSGV